jgi:hypothetical protein
MWVRGRIIRRALRRLCLVLDAPESEHEMRRAIGGWVRIGTVLIATLTAAVGARAQPTWHRGDSVVMRRAGSGCAGPCVDYRLRVSADGAVEFLSLRRGEGRRVERASRGPVVWRSIADAFGRIAFETLPPLDVGEAPLCRRIVTDATTIIITWFGGDVVHVRDYYLGCLGDGSSVNATSSYLGRLSALAAHIDSVAGVAPWLGR